MWEVYVMAFIIAAPIGLIMYKVMEWVEPWIGGTGRKEKVD